MYPLKETIYNTIREDFTPTACITIQNTTNRNINVSAWASGNRGAQRWLSFHEGCDTAKNPTTFINMPPNTEKTVILTTQSEIMHGSSIYFETNNRLVKTDYNQRTQIVRLIPR